VNANGNRSGFGYDYYMQMQKYTRWEYEFVEASYADCLKMLLSGEIDVMGGIRMTDERAQQVIFGRYSVSSSQNKLYARADKENLYYESYDAFDGCRVAILRGSLSDELHSYCEEHGFSVVIMEYDGPSDMYAALKSGEVDMIYSSSISEEIETKIVAHMDKTPLYYAVAKDRPELATELDNALRQIIDNNPNFYTQLSTKYMVSGANATATFTRQELDYIRSGQKAYVIMNASWAPISWYDAASGTYRGIFVDVIKRIEQYSGLEFVLCTEDEFNTDILARDPEAVNNVIAILADDNSWAVTQNVLMSNHVVDSSVVMVTRRGVRQAEEMEKPRIVLPTRFYISWCMRDDFTADQVTYYPTVQECLDEINAGRADATYVNELVATYYLSMLEYSDLFASANSGYSENLAFAVNKDSEHPLLGILDKSLLCIGQKDLNQIVVSNSIAEQRTSLKGLYFSNPVLVISLSCLVLALLGGGGVLLWFTRARRRRMARELEKDAETSAARTEFFMMISHELRTPLNAIVGYLNLAAEQCPVSCQEYVKRSQNAARQLSHIAEDMLDYTRIASDTASLREEAFDLKSTIGDVEQNISLEAEKKNLSFRFTLHDLENEFVMGDRLRISQIMQNLLSNAVKFTDAGGSVTADVAQKKQDDGSVEFIFSARDTGRGMTEEYLQKVCAPFQQSDKAYSRTHGGLGLGLYLTKYYLEAMHGALEVTSRVGVGSQFTVRIPLKPVSSTQAAAQQVDLSHMRVVIGGTDDEENQQLKATLKRLNIKSDALTDAEKVARRILTRSTGDYAYSLCLLDESLLDENDEPLRTIARYENAPAIFVLTGSARRMEELALKPEIRHVLYKPIFQSVLFNAIMEDFGEYRTH
ncbi:MAG: transporter substrate-binding domain-containing protein, partial [Eubacteriales bacterium]|nr:transporter substrate-binding domain-containing protein [Eubacteriales bacterium]